MSKEIVKEFYGQDEHEEFNRLIKDAFHRLELNTTLHFLDKYLPKSGHVLDAGGGPGRYTLELAQRGFDITHLDITPYYNEYTKKVMSENNLSYKLIATVNGDICNLKVFADNSFDGVICLGAPLSHVVDKLERKKAISELIRVAKSGSYIFCSVISRFAVFKTVLIECPEELKMDIFSTYKNDGNYDGSNGFTSCHFFLAEDLKKEFDRPEVEFVNLVGLEGLATGNDESLNNLYANDKAAFEIWWQTHLQYCTHPALVDTSEHMLIVCRKK